MEPGKEKPKILEGINIPARCVIRQITVFLIKDISKGILLKYSVALNILLHQFHN